MIEMKGIIDCDVHPYPRNKDIIKEYLSEPWRSRFEGDHKRGIYDNPIHGNRLDAIPPGGGFQCSDPAYLRKQLLDEYGINYAILLPRAFAPRYPQPDFASAVAAAYNDWLADVWLDHNNEDGRCKGSISIAHQDPLASSKEIKRWKDHPHMVQVLMDSGSRAPFGQRQYYPIYEMCEEYNLPVALHIGTEAAGVNEPPTAGYPTTYIEFHTGLILSFQAHLISFITEGVFEKFPGLKVVLVEGGSAWLSPLLWRLDAEWKALREEVPWVKKLPSEYIKDHVRITTQPLEVPEKKEYLLQIFEMMDAKNILMFSSDYPHWDFDSPTRAFPKLPEDLYRRIFYDNAKEFYRLD